METIATSVQPFTALETIAAEVLEVEQQIEAFSDYEERKQLRKKEEQLREEELFFLRLSTGNAFDRTKIFYRLLLISLLLLFRSLGIAAMEPFYPRSSSGVAPTSATSGMFCLMSSFDMSAVLFLGVIG